MNQQSMELFDEIFESSIHLHSPEIKSMDPIPTLINYISSKENPIKERVKYLYSLTNYIKDNRFLAEYFSYINSSSIYISLFNIFLDQDDMDPQLRDNILHCIDILIINIETPKELFEFIYQQLSLLYRNVNEINKDILNSYLILLSHLYGDTQLSQKPRNYFAFCGKGRMEVNLVKEISIQTPITFSLAFKPKYLKYKSSTNILKKFELINFKCNNNQTLSIIIDTSLVMYIKDRNKKFNISLPRDEWISLVVSLVPTDDFKLKLFMFADEKNPIMIDALDDFRIESDTTITSMSFFEDFIGEVGSVSMLIQQEKGYPGVIDPNVMEGLSKFSQGLWKKSLSDQFFSFLHKNSSIDLSRKSIFSKKKEEIQQSLVGDVVFVFAPYTCEGQCIEGLIGNYTGTLTEYTKVHTYKEYQKRIILIGGIKNLLPIAEMILLNPKVLCEDIMFNFLQIIYNILKDRKYNMNDAYKSEFFKLLSLFIEKFPSNIFTENILIKMIDLAKIMFSETVRELPSVFFDHILLNEKIFSKYSQSLHNTFWTEILEFFCQSDIGQIVCYLNMKKICLILRYYDETKYYEMCCGEHYSQFKPEYVGNTQIMSPTMNDKLLYLKNIIILIFENTSNLQESENPSTLFSLLTLDLSPCLARFIIEIFICAIKTKGIPIIENLFKNNFGSIIANTMRHSLLNERAEILKLIHVVISMISSSGEFRNDQKQLCKMLKSCLLPEHMFYSEETSLNIDPVIIKEIAAHCVLKMTKNNKSDFEKKSIDNVIVFDDDKYAKYIDRLYCLFINWSVGEDITNENISKTKLNIKNRELKNLFALEILLYVNDKINDIEFTLHLIKNIEMLIENPKNCKMILSNLIIFGWLLDIAFLNFQKKDNNSNTEIFTISTKAIIKILIESINYDNDGTYCLSDTSLSVITLTSASYPILSLETLLIWGNKVRNGHNDLLVLELISNILYEFSETLLILIPKDFLNDNLRKSSSADQLKQSKNEYLKDTFLFFSSFLYNYYCHYKNEPIILSKGPDILRTSSNSIILPEGYISGMNFSVKKTSNSNELFWNDFKFFDIIFNKFSFIWSKDNTMKGITHKNIKNQALKYEKIINDIILNKSTKNIFITELRLLCREVRLNDKIIQTPLIRIFSTTFAMLIITSQIQNKEENQLSYWLKGYKNFLKFLILSSSNITLINQLELYNALTEKCIDGIVFGISFLKDEYTEKVRFKAQIKKPLTSIVSFCFLIVGKQLSYIESHKSILKISIKPARNDLAHSAVFRIFHELVIHSEDQPVLTPQKLRDNKTSQNCNCADELLKEEWKYTFFANDKLKARIEKNIFGMLDYQTSCKERYEQINGMINQIDISYQKDIFDLVPKYEIELEKYSNNSFIIQKQKRNKYKKFKKQLFTWRGMWSDHKLFYNNIDKLKVKMVNHYTKCLARPLLAPILDLDYYIPAFTDFSINQMFRDYTDENFKYNLDIDQIIKTKTQIVSNEKVCLESKDNYIKDIYSKSNPQLANLYLKIANKLDFKKDDEFIDIFQKTSTSNTKENDNNRKHYQCCFVKTSHHIKGMMFVEKNEIIFRLFLNQRKAGVLIDMDIIVKDIIDEDYDSDRKTCYGSYFVCHHKDKDLLTFSLPYEQIKFFLRKRYYYKKTAIEIFSKANKSYYFNFKKEEDRENVIKDILNCVKEYKPIRNDLKDTKDDYDYVMGYETCVTSENKKLKKLRLSDKVSKWCNWEISTFELLMWLNIYSNRSFSDLTQYPVMPWIFNNYSESMIVNEQKYFRDLSSPIGMLEIYEESKLRKEIFKETFESMKAEEDETGAKPYFYGSHYSNPFYVCNFLIRLFPFSHISVELQGHRFDNAERLFLSVEKAFCNSLTMKTDVRELTPEFFYLPEIFKNINNLNLGSLETSEQVDDVETPCKNNPYDFVMLMREALESSCASLSIQKWIDLIFGFKQRGKEGENACNIFIGSSYEDQINLSKEENKLVLLHLVEFGLTPGQSITKEFSCRNRKELTSKYKEVTRENANLVACTTRNKNDKIILPSSKVLISKITEKEKILSVMADFTLFITKVNYSIIEKKYLSEIIKCNLSLNKKVSGRMHNFYKSKQTNNKHIAIYNKGKSIAIGGFSDDKILIISYNDHGISKAYIPCSFDPSPVTTIVFDKEEEFAFCGNQNGNVNIFKIENEKWILWKQLIDHTGAITHIFCSDELNLWASTSADGFVNLYKMPTCNIIRTISFQGEHLDYVFLSACPLPSILIYSSETRSFHVYSINGKDLMRNMKVTSDCGIQSPIMLKDIFFNDYLAYIVDNKVTIRSIPLLFPTHNVTISLERPIECLTVSEDYLILYGISDDGNSAVVICDHKEENEANN